MQLENLTKIAASTPQTPVLVYAKPSSKAPFKKRLQDGGFDFHVDLIDTFGSDASIQVAPHQVVKLSTGTRCVFPDETVWIWDVRSSMGVLGLDVCCRTIDNNYTGVLSVVIVNNSSEPITIRHLDRVAQLIPNPFHSGFYIQEVSEEQIKPKDDRGCGGFGSSGR